MSYHIISYHVISYHIIPYHTTPHHTTPHHITLHHTTPHHITLHRPNPITSLRSTMNVTPFFSSPSFPTHDPTTSPPSHYVFALLYTSSSHSKQVSFQYTTQLTPNHHTTTIQLTCNQYSINM